jgi:hypothetical protein
MGQSHQEAETTGVAKKQQTNELNIYKKNIKLSWGQPPLFHHRALAS